MKVEKIDSKKLAKKSLEKARESFDDDIQVAIAMISVVQSEFIDKLNQIIEKLNELDAKINTE